MTQVDRNDPRTSYQQIADDLRRRISSGELAPGRRLESTRVLASRYGVAPMTIHEAVRLLKSEGIVRSQPGRGTFVRAEGDENQPPQDLPSAVAELRSRVDALAANDASTDEQLAELRRQLARSQAQIMELYARAGLQYPTDDTAPATATPRRRKASGE
jgi:DNA-binding GntR family transcriptional regulator